MAKEYEVTKTFFGRITIKAENYEDACSQANNLTVDDFNSLEDDNYEVDSTGFEDEE